MLATLVAYGLSAQLHEDDNSLIHPGIFVHYSLFFQLSISFLRSTLGEEKIMDKQQET